MTTSLPPQPTSPTSSIVASLKRSASFHATNDFSKISKRPRLLQHDASMSISGSSDDTGVSYASTVTLASATATSTVSMKDDEYDVQGQRTDLGDDGSAMFEKDVMILTERMDNNWTLSNLRQWRKQQSDDETMSTTSTPRTANVVSVKERQRKAKREVMKILRVGSMRQAEENADSPGDGNPLNL